MTSTTVGYFGKLPCIGDFATRRLPRSFVQPWDDWLQCALPACRDMLGPCWLDVYLASPFWRFVLAPGVCGPEVWRGVLMPSMDRVGRPFPLTVAQPLHSDCGAFERTLHSEAWFIAIEDVMLSALRPELQPDRLDQQLADVAAVDARAPRPSAACQQTPWRLDLPQAGAGAHAWAPVLDGLASTTRSPWCCWSTTGSQQMPRSLFMCAGLPPEHGFAALLGGAGVDADRTVSRVATLPSNA